jgi:hypothetical protein
MFKSRMKVWSGVALGAILGFVVAAHAAGFFTNGVPVAGGTQFPSTLPLTGLEQIPADTLLAGGASPQSEAITTNQLASFVGSPGTGLNFLIGGDSTTNLYQRATSGASVTTTTTYGGPDRWFYWSGTNTAMTVSQDTTAGDLTPGFKSAFKMARTAAQTGVVPVCMGQVIETVNAIQLAGSTVEASFNAFTGATFSAAAPFNMTVFITTGTGTDEGSAKFAFGINGGGGGGSGWTGQANATAAVVSLGGVSTAGRYAAVANIPATATEVGIALCFTPTGTAGANDYIAFEGIQLIKNNGQSALASATLGFNCTTGIQCKAFDKRLQTLESNYQQRYFYSLKETAAASAFAPCWASSVTVAQCLLTFPTTMRAGPVFSGDGGFTAGFAVPTTTAGGTLGACTALAVSVNIASTVATTQDVLLACTATTVPAAGSAGMLYNNGAAGVIKASAEL